MSVAGGRLRSTGRALDAPLTLVTRLLLAVAGLLLLVTIGVIALDVALRTLRGRGIAAANEYSSVLQVTFVFAGLAWAYRRGALVNVTLATTRMPPRVASACRVVGVAVLLAFAGWLCAESWQVALKSMADHEVRFGIARVEIWPARLALAIGLTAFVLEVLAASIRAVAGSAPAAEDDAAVLY